jgi:hypothetical protein
MKKEDLQQKLADFASKIKEGTANSTDLSAMKNFIQDAYNSESIPKDLKGELGKKASYAFNNRFSSKGLSDLTSKIAEKGGTVAKFEKAVEPAIGKVARTAGELGGMGKKMRSFGPLLGMLGAGAAAMGVGNKAMAGDIGGAGMDAADLATDYIPGISQAKMALQSDPLGQGSDEVAKKEQFDFTPFKVKNPSMDQNTAINDSSANAGILPSKVQAPIDATQERPKYSELLKMFGNKRQP